MGVKLNLEHFRHLQDVVKFQVNPLIDFKHNIITN